MTERGDPEVTVGDDATLQARLCTVVRDAARRGIAERGRWSIAIPGGSVATRLLPALARDDIPWRGGALWPSWAAGPP